MQGIKAHDEHEPRVLGLGKKVRRDFFSLMSSFLLISPIYTTEVQAGTAPKLLPLLLPSGVTSAQPTPTRARP